MINNARFNDVWSLQHKTAQMANRVSNCHVATLQKTKLCNLLRGSTFIQSAALCPIEHGKLSIFATIISRDFQPK